ncbi:MAG: Crp/Fnr family transcriptional regulator [Rudaea sp.]|nr:Crp/Fnr family transcriptional regulator [Rudaea sp.]
MNAVQIQAALAGHPFLAGLPPSDIEKLAALAFEVHFQPEQIIFREGDPSSFFYLILSGHIALEVQTPGRVLRIQTIGAGEELGWSSLLASVNKQFQARCLEPGAALAFDGAQIVAQCENDMAFGFRLLRKVLATVADRLRATRLQLLDVYAGRGGGGQ